MNRIALSEIVSDAGTQIRAAVNEQTVADYADRMTEGVTFPPVVLFHDGNRYYLADGFHRVLAANRNQFRDISADVRKGTLQDALWFALGANKANGQRLTGADKKHAIRMALYTWPDRSSNEISDQIGCSRKWVQDVRHELQEASGSQPDQVIGRDGRSYPARRGARTEKRAAIAEAVKSGESSKSIEQRLKAHPSQIAATRKELGLSTRQDQSRDAVAARRTRVREMAAGGFSAPQISQDVGLSEESIRILARRECFEIPGDNAIKNTRRHDANRIVSQMVTDAENLTADVNLIDFAQLDADSIQGWLVSLYGSRKSLNSFIRRLELEQKQYGEAAHTATLEDSASADRDDASPARAGHSA